MAKNKVAKKYRDLILSEIGKEGKEYLYLIEEAKLIFLGDRAGIRSFVKAFCLDFNLISDSISFTLMPVEEIMDKFFKYLEMRGFKDLTEEKYAYFKASTGFQYSGILSERMTINSKVGTLFIVNKNHELARFDEEYKKFKDYKNVQKPSV